MLESLDRDYKREEDWCGTERANISDKPSYMVQLINKHNEQKEAFLKVLFSLQNILDYALNTDNEATLFFACWVNFHAFLVF